jgi:hypothetical protein
MFLRNQAFLEGKVSVPSLLTVNATKPRCSVRTTLATFQSITFITRRQSAPTRAPVAAVARTHQNTALFYPPPPSVVVLAGFGMWLGCCMV